MDPASYLERIGYRGPLRPGISVLRALHRRHLYSVPFENLDIHLGRPIVLDQQRFYDKIVKDHRGGYCYELNGCFAWLLKRMGFRVSMLSARVARKDGGYSPEFDHMTLLVHLKERWLADVGFGDLFTEPKRVDDPDQQHDRGRSFQIERRSGTRVLSRWDEESRSWKTQYAFSLHRYKLADFARRNRYQQSSLRSHFTQGRLISKLTQDGRITLTDTRLILTSRDKRVERPLKSRGEFDRLLAKHFQLSLGYRKRGH